MADRVLETAEHSDLIPVLADTLVTKGSALGALGRVHEATAVVEAGRELAEAAGLTTIALRALNNTATWSSFASPRAVFEMARGAGLAHSRRIGASTWVYGFAANLGYNGFRVGEWNVAQAELEAALPDATDPADRALLLNNLINVRAARGDEHADEMAELRRIVVSMSEDLWEGLTLEGDGWIAFASGDPVAAHAAWRRNAEVLVVRRPIRAHAGGARGRSGPRRRPRHRRARGLRRPRRPRRRRRGRSDRHPGGHRRARGSTPRGHLGDRTAIAAWQSLDLPWDEALTTIEMAQLLDPRCRRCRRPPPARARSWRGGRGRSWLSSTPRSPRIRVPRPACPEWSTRHRR